MISSSFAIISSNLSMRFLSFSVFSSSSLWTDLWHSLNACLRSLRKRWHYCSFPPSWDWIESFVAWSSLAMLSQVLMLHWFRPSRWKSVVLEAVGGWWGVGRDADWPVSIMTHFEDCLPRFPASWDFSLTFFAYIRNHIHRIAVLHENPSPGSSLASQFNILEKE